MIAYKQPTLSPPSRQRGLSLIGILFALVIGLGVLAGVASLFNDADNAADSAADIRAVTALQGAIKSIYHTPRYSGLSLPRLDSSNVLPSSLTMLHGSNAQMPSGGEIRLFGMSNQYVLIVNSVRQSACPAFTGAMSSLFATVRLGAETLKSESVAFDPSAALAACGALDGEFANTILLWSN